MTSNWKDGRARQHSLYPGQREALTRRAEGASNTAIGEAMGVNRQTVASYLGGAREALGAPSIDAAVGFATIRGLIPFYRGTVDS
jgi:DNA-binding CsgD family transcriptional regulator